ncbi:Cyclin-dependent protein kinase inhibitor SMR3 [Spatholobus suberectus]|nr:Cyclin-dependent protein kinase inhibitor SMR3 [Spatholobus suberectus]
MLSESAGSSFCVMGVSSNSKVFLSDKDLKGGNNMDPEVGLLVRPALEKIHKGECQTSTQEDHQLVRLKQLSVQERDQQKGDKDHHQEEQKQRSDITVSKPVSVSPLNLKIEIPSYLGSENDDSSNDGFKTPTSSDHKIPVILECPGAPRKTKSGPATKRKACRRRIVLDLSKELESLFPVPYVVDLGGGVVNKRVKQCSGTDSKTWHMG